MTGPTLAAIRQRLKAMKAALEIASHEQTHHCLNPVAVRQIVVDANTLLARLAGSVTACEDNAKRIGMLVQQLNDAKDRLAASEESRQFEYRGRFT